jgi:hypothetical protein
MGYYLCIASSKFRTPLLLKQTVSFSEDKSATTTEKRGKNDKRKRKRFDDISCHFFPLGCSSADFVDSVVPLDF